MCFLKTILSSDLSPFENGDLEMTGGFATSDTSKPMPIVCLNLKLCQVLPYKDIKHGYSLNATFLFYRLCFKSSVLCSFPLLFPWSVPVEVKELNDQRSLV